MTDLIHSLLFNDFFVPNRKITITGEHFFADKNLFANFYGISFFSSPKDFWDNPYISPQYANKPGILDEYFDDDIPKSNQIPIQSGKIANAITKTVSEKYILKPSKNKSSQTFNFQGTFDCFAETQNNGTMCFQYGSIMPNILGVTNGNSVTAILPFSPLSNIAFSKDKRTLQSVNLQISQEADFPPENLTIDYATTVKALSVDLDCNLCGKIDLSYIISIGTAKCETSKIQFFISNINEQNINQQNLQE